MTKNELFNRFHDVGKTLMQPKFLRIESIYRNESIHVKSRKNVMSRNLTETKETHEDDDGNMLIPERLMD